MSLKNDTMINTVIIDDERLAIESLRWEIDNFCKEIKVVETFTNPKDAISGINYLKPELVFLDIEMPELDGFQLLQLLDYKNFDLIIITAYNQYAIKAFKANAIDYLLKPVDPDELVSAVEKVKARRKDNVQNKNIETILSKLLDDHKSEAQRIPLLLSNKVIMVNAEEITYCKSDGAYTHVYLEDGNDHFVSKSIKNLEKILPPDIFIRVHKSYIVNYKKIVEFIRTGNGELVLSNEQVIPVSRTHKNKVLKILKIL